MASSLHRKGATVQLSLAAYVGEKLRRADVLEKQLVDLPTPSANNAAKTNKHVEEQAARLRMKLCEILSDILLTDPGVSHEKDCIGRLWRHCFYGHIGVMRLRLSREKRKKGPNVSRYEKILSSFIAEAVALYDYLVAQFHDKLVKAVTMAGDNNPDSMVSSSSNTQGSQSQSQSQSQGSQTQSQHPKSTEDTTGVVPILFRMYIHLGDLHRYSSSYGKSQTFYFQASKLAPGVGNPYNQLAVVAQLKDTDAPLNCVALYWYARSLLTTHEPFEISKANLARLFQSNREWFGKQPLPPDDVLQPKPADGNNNAGGRDMQRSQRTALSRHFLSKFVDLHFSFFQGVTVGGDQIMADSKDTSLLSDEAVIDQIQSALGPFSVLLKASAFGDALLCKMVTICVFSEVYNPVAAMQQTDPSRERANQLRETAARLTPIMARTLTLALGACLAERAMVGLIKIKDQPERMGNPGKAPPSVRLMLPLLLVFEFVESRPVDFGNVQSAYTRDYCEKTLDRFWQQVAEVMNILTNLRSPLQLDADLADGKLQEYQNLLGFSPFESFLNDDRASSRDSGFASVEEAVDVLELLRANATQESVGPTQESSSTEEYKIKVARFLAVGDRVADRSGRFIRSPNGLYGWMVKDEVMVAEGYDNDMLMMDTEDDKEETQPPGAAENDAGDDVLVYNVPEGGGPALLVPGMLLQNRAIAAGNNGEHMSTSNGAPASFAPMDENDNTMGFPSMEMAAVGGSHVAPQQPQPMVTANPPRLMPPPGFGGGAIAPPVGFLSSVPPHNMAAYAQPMNMVSPQGVPVQQGNDALPQGFVQGMVASSFIPQQGYVSHDHGVPTIGDSFHWFGGAQALQTDNPFAAASMPTHDVTGLIPNQMGVGGLTLGGTGGYSGSSFLGADNSGDAESSLLGSGLLTSLWMDGTDKPEKSTQNPFR